MYNTFLFLHIVGVIVWIGGALTLTVLNLRLAREPSAAVRESLSSAGEFFGHTVFGPATALTLLAGIAMIGMMGWATPLWVIWGLGGLFASGFIGSVFVGRSARALTELTRDGGADILQVTALRRRVTLLSLLDLLILLSVVWAMIFKPTVQG